MELKGPGTDATTKVCALCGRIGVRRFKVIMMAYLDAEHPVILCAGARACAKRWIDDGECSGDG